MVLEISLFVEHIRNTAAHAGSKVAAGCAQYYDSAAGHVLTAVITNPFNYGIDAGVPDTEALACHAANIGGAAGGAVKCHVSGNDVLFCHKA